MRKFTKLLLILVLYLIGLQAYGQNVTIEPSTGNLVAALTYEGESGFSAGLNSLWRHEQLALSLTTSDDEDLTTSGEISNPSAALGQKNGKLIFVSGHMPLFFVVSLPNGYRFTGYELILKNDLVGENICQPGSDPAYTEFKALPAGDNKIMRFYETKPWANTGVRPNGYNNLNPAGSQVIGQAKADDGTTDIYFNEENKGKEFKLSRFSEDEMGNQLYFRLTKNAFFCGLTIKSFTLYFTAEGTFTAEVKPSALSSTPTSMVPLPFYTNKIDFGEMDSYTKDGVTYFSYHHENVQDLMAFNYLYQNDALEDDAPADVAPVKKIYQTQNNGNHYFGLKNGLYYVETPVTITNSSGNKAPIGYRIVGAKLNYAYGVQSGAGTQQEDYYEITYTSGGTTYYLQADGYFGTSSTAKWYIDNNNNIYTAGANGNIYLTYGNSGRNYYLSTGGSNSNQKVSYNNSGYVTIRPRGSGNTLYYLQGTTSATTQPAFSTNNSNPAICAQTTNEYEIYPAFTPEQYTIKVYDKTGKTVEETITVSQGSGSYDWGLLNNDAVKFEIEGVDGDNGMALVTVDLYLQALDPYIDKMDIVCHDENNVLELTQSFTADNFKVSGGRFVFYVPADYGNEDLTFTFRDLYSKYGDESYYNGSGEGFSRYSYVTSEYFFKYDGYTNGNGGLYDTNYNPDYPYDTKVYTSTAGNIRFKFNNAEDLSNTGASTEDHYLEEYPFSTTNYLNSVDPDAAAGTEATEAAFVPVVLNASKELQKSGIFYVFTADETRWNIAPSKAWQHRFYAYYRMELEVIARTFEPELTWEKIYDKTCAFNEDVFPVSDAEETPQGHVSTESMWGLKLRTKDPESHEYFDQGYLTYQEIINAIDDSLDPDNEDAPATTEQILYVDGSKIFQMLNSSKNSVVKTLSDLKDLLAVNALVFLPENNTSTLNNVAFKTSSGSFFAGKDIVLTDRMPFYTPYQIQVDAANKATYTRTVTRNVYGKDLLASVMLPYALRVNQGVHTNPDGSTFKLTQLTNADLTLEVQQQNDYYGVGFFDAVEGTATKANVPYMVVVDEESGDTGDFSFVATQAGATIAATTGMKNRTVGGGVYDYLFFGNEVTGSVDIPGGSLGLTPEGSYSGQIYDRAHSEAIFYFAENKFYNLYRLVSSKRYLYLYPFRGVYTFDANSAVSNVKNMNGIDISFEESGNLDHIIDRANTQVPDLAVRTGKGFIQLTSTKDQSVNILSLNGISYSKVNLEAGGSKTVVLPAGVYVVNNVKIIVK